MKIDKTVIKETGYITVGQVCLCAVLLTVYFFISKLSWLVLIGAVSGCILGILNFFFMGFTIQKVLNAREDDRVMMIRASQITRLMLIALIIVILLAVAKLDPIATLVPLLFPRITVMIRSLFLNKKGGDQSE